MAKRDERMEKLTDLIGEANALAQELANEWLAEHDERSEKWQAGEKGEAARERIEAMQTIADALDNAGAELGALE